MVSVDSRIPNLALMKLSAWHKKRGDSVKLFSPLFDSPELIYASKVFTDTPDFEYFPEGVPVVKGGTGYDIHSELPPEVDSICPDYFLFPDCYAMGFTTRGCIRKCPFCVVPEKEGRIREVADIYQFWTGQEHLMLLDNNLTAAPEHFALVVRQLIKERIVVDFSQGLDIRLITPDMAQLLAKVRLWKQIHIAFDNLSVESAVRSGVALLKENGVPPRKLMAYVLIGYDTTPEEDLYRVEVLRALKVDPFVMPFNRDDPYQKRFARWVNHKAIFMSTPWEKYMPSRKGKAVAEGGLCGEGRVHPETLCGQVPRQV